MQCERLIWWENGEHERQLGAQFNSLFSAIVRDLEDGKEQDVVEEYLMPFASRNRTWLNSRSHLAGGCGDHLS